ncbi:MAG TPA: PAS domain S-box protein, partial [Gemmata sp.]
RLLVDAVTGVALVLLDSGGRVASWNIGAERLTGFTRDQVAGKPVTFLSACGDGTTEHPKADLRTAIESGPVEEERWCRRADGAPVRVRYTLTALHEGTRHVGFSVCLRAAPDPEPGADRFRRAEAAARQANELLRAVADGTTDAVFVKDREGKYLLFNEVAARFVGKPAAEVLGKDDTTLFDPAGARAVMERDRRVMASGLPETEEEVLAAAGVTRTYQATKAPYRDATGAVVGVIGISRDVTEWKRAEAALLSSEARFRSVWEHARDAMRVLDENGAIVAVNAAFCQLFGRPREELEGQPFTVTYMGARDPAELLRLYRERARERCIPAHTERRVLLRGGRTVDLEITSTLIEQPGRPALLLGLFRDITARKRAEEALERERGLLRTLIDALPDAIWTKDAGARFVISNRAHDELVGATSESAVAGKTDFDLHPPDLARQYREDDLRVLRSGETVFNKEEPVRDRQGRPRWHLVIKAPLRDRTGRVVGLVGISRDIQERKAAEEALRASEERFQAFFDTTTAAMVEIAPDARYLRANAAFYRMFGYAPEDLPNLTVGDLVYPEERAAVLAQYARVGRGEIASYEADRRYRRKDGSTLWARVSVVAARDEAGRPELVTAVVIDLTERKKLEEQFRQAQKMEAVGRLAGGIAHDFNNLLTVINGYTDLLSRSARPTDPTHAPIAAIAAAGERAAGLTAQLLAFSRKAIIEPKVIDLNDLVSQSAQLLRRVIGEDITLAAVLAPGPARVRVDPGQIEQAIMNLAVNARDAMPKGGRLTIETLAVTIEAGPPGTPDLKPGSYVQLTVTDTGTGMTDEVQARIFEPFFTTKGLGEGTGLGLATVYGIAQTYGGHISVSSELGTGTTFKLLFPALAEEPPPLPPPPPPAAPRGTETVLLVEDDAGVRGVAALALRMHGYEVLEAARGAEAIQKAQAHPGTIHLLLTDVVMPGLGGREVAEAVREKRPGIKVIFMSGYTDDAVVRHGIVEASAAFLQKPFTPAPLVRKLRAVLDGTT